MLPGPATAASLSQFVADYTAGRLSRTLVSRGAGTGTAGTGTGPGPAAAAQWRTGGPRWSFSSVPAAGGGAEEADDTEEATDGDGPSAPADGDGSCVRPSHEPSACGGLTAGVWSSPAVRGPAVRPLAGPVELTSDTFRQVALNTSEVSGLSPRRGHSRARGWSVRVCVWGGGGRKYR